MVVYTVCCSISQLEACSTERQGAQPFQGHRHPDLQPHTCQALQEPEGLITSHFVNRDEERDRARLETEGFGSLPGCLTLSWGCGPAPLPEPEFGQKTPAPPGQLMSSILRDTGSLCPWLFWASALSRARRVKAKAKAATTVSGTDICSPPIELMATVPSLPRLCIIIESKLHLSETVDG